MGRLIKEIRNHIDLKVKSLKLTAAEQMAMVLSKALAVLVFVLLLAFAFLLFTVAATLLLGNLIGSVIGAAAIMGGLYLIVALLFYFMRDTIFLDSMVGMLCGVMFPEKAYDEDVYENKSETREYREECTAMREEEDDYE